jgi:hypothetical protein
MLDKAASLRERCLKVATAMLGYKLLVRLD